MTFFTKVKNFSRILPYILQVLVEYRLAFFKVVHIGVHQTNRNSMPGAGRFQLLKNKTNAVVTCFVRNIKRQSNNIAIWTYVFLGLGVRIFLL